ncbi:hypothetical protein [Streptacidiphilus sp. P02-A3a]|uniref:hypothetical protein n=1 Tax=Streptacidiphilus sp. P02-A3a TaxID=2704468 RepID=UPI0015F9E1FB|nr:hypothetical protein [Streptacidiphilus sp. P02-A3a]QMU68075.1 hypothetical protein GXP74_07415 [Streptacidiphilus sp. P02-A3a]
MPSDIEFDFVRALQDAAGSAVQPPPAELYAEGVERGLRIRRRTTFRRTLALSVALVLTAAVRIALLAGTPNTTSMDVTASTTATTTATATATATPDASDSASGGSTNTTAAWMPGYLLQTFSSLVPAGSRTTMEGDDAVVAPELSPSGRWNTRLATELTTPAGASMVSLSVQGSPLTARCPGHAVAPYDDCTSTPVAGGTLLVDLAPTTGAGITTWSLYWNGPEGQSVSLIETTGTSRQALTLPQATALVSTPAWDRVWKSLPEPCPWGAMINPGATATQLASGAGFVCATSRAAATTIGAQASSRAVN